MAREYAVTLSSKGQVTLPAALRRELGIDRGAKLRLILRDDSTLEVAKQRFSRVADLAALGHQRAMSQRPQELRELAHAERWRDKQARSQ